jgi:hypothetical protein
MAKRRGRPRKNGLRNRNGRLLRPREVPDLGPEQVQRLRQLLNGRLDLPVTPLASLYSRGFLDAASYTAGCRFSALTAIARGGWGFQDGSVAQLYHRLLAGEGGEAFVRVTNGHDHCFADDCRALVAQMRCELQRQSEDGAVLSAVTSVCVDQAWLPWIKRILSHVPELRGDYVQLGLLREGLHRLAELTAARRLPDPGLVARDNTYPLSRRV